MNAALFPEKLLRLDSSAQLPIELATSGVQRYIWESRFGDILIEVIGDQAYVNGQVVEKATEPPAG